MTNKRNRVGDRFSFDLTPIATRTLMDVFGKDDLEPYIVDQKLWDYLLNNGIAITEREQSDVNGDWGDWNEEPLIIDENDENIEILGFESFSGFGQFQVNFESVRSTHLGDVLGTGQMTATEMYKKLRNFIAERKLLRYLPEPP